MSIFGSGDSVALWLASRTADNFQMWAVCPLVKPPFNKKARCVCNNHFKRLLGLHLFFLVLYTHCLIVAT